MSCFAFFCQIDQLGSKTVRRGLTPAGPTSLPNRPVSPALSRRSVRTEPIRRRPARVRRHGPGRRHAGRFLQLWKEGTVLPVVEVHRTGTGKNVVLPD